jgi:hypothetical protein
MAIGWAMLFEEKYRPKQKKQYRLAKAWRSVAAKAKICVKAVKALNISASKCGYETKWLFGLLKLNINKYGGVFCIQYFNTYNLDTSILASSSINQLPA